MTIEECIYQCEFNCKTLNSGCVECDEKARDFYQSVITYLKKYKKITLDNRELQKQKEYESRNKRADSLTPTCETSLRVLNLSVRSLNCLLRSGITSVEQLESINPNNLKKIRNLGKKSFNEIIEELSRYNQNKEEKENDQKRI